jgi:predicted ArsR family transcriptional regulator
MRASQSASPARTSDGPIVELLRRGSTLGVDELATQLGVTATAVRQRLQRLMQSGVVERCRVARPRGRPAYAYSLTTRGHQLGGNNFRDLALVLWREIRGISDSSVKRGLVGRIGAALAAECRDRVAGTTTTERLQSLAAILGEQDIHCVVEDEHLPVLVNYACPYPDLAEQDRGICAVERHMLEDLVGADLRLTDCRLDGGNCCRFQVAGPTPGGTARGT